MGRDDSAMLLAAAEELLKRRRARESFLHYNRYIAEAEAGLGSDDPVEPEYPAKHHELLCTALQALADKGALWGYPVRNLIVMMPPGSAKSTYATVRFPAWYIGRFGRRGVVSASYNQTLADHFGAKVRNLVKSAAHQVIFPRCSLSEDSRAKGEWNTENGGFYFAVGVGAGVTGRRGDLAIGDDLIKGKEDADSEVIREKTWEFWKADVRTRLKPTHAARVLIATRWHEDDPIGKILPDSWNGESCVVRGKDEDVWHVICLPAEARKGDILGRKEGEWLWPEYTTPEHWKRERAAQGGHSSRNWTSLYQQQPRPDSGTRFRREWFDETMYGPSDLPTHLNVYGSSDWAFTEDSVADFTEHAIWGEDKDGHLWALDWYYAQDETEKANGDGTVDNQIRLMRRWNPLKWFGRKGKDENAVGPARRKLLQELAMKGKGVRTEYELLPDSQDKIVKSTSFRDRAMRGMVHFPKGTPWAARVIDQLVAFPAGRWDDAVDTCGTAGAGLDKMHAAQTPEERKRQVIEPFTIQWLMSSEEPDNVRPRSYYE